MLHTIHNSPLCTNDLDSCIRVVREGDDLFLYEDAVVACLAGNDWTERLTALVESGVRVSVLRPDLDARGIPVERLVAGLVPVGYEGFVGLVEKHAVTQAW